MEAAYARLYVCIVVREEKAIAASGRASACPFDVEADARQICSAIFNPNRNCVTFIEVSSEPELR